MSVHSEIYKEQRMHDLLQAVIPGLLTLGSTIIIGEETLSSSSRGQLELSITELIKSQQVVDKLLSPPNIEPGTSKGMLLKVMKNNKTRGYLFGTMHHLITENLQQAMNISATVQKKLYECAVLATEVAVTEKTLILDSVEKRLIKWAGGRGIMNVGIDAENAEKLVLIDQDESPENNEEKDKFEKLIKRTDLFAEAYCTGNISAMQSLVEEGQIRDKDDKEQTMRNSAMAQKYRCLFTSF